MTYRTIRYVGKEQVEIVPVEAPDPGPGEVQIEGLACGVCAFDLHIFKNGFDNPPPGHEGVGRILKVGAGVKDLKEGDWVVGGSLGFAERVTCPRTRLYVLPRTRRPRDWIVEPVACIVNGLDHCNLRAGDRIAVVGCGFMGMMFLQALGHSLVDQLIAIDVDDKRLGQAKQFGATMTCNARSVEPAKLRELSIDTVVDCSGSQAGLDLSSKILKNGGRLNLFGWNHGTGTFPGDLWHMHGINVVNSAPASALRDLWPPAIRLLDRKFVDLEPLITHVVSLDEYPELLRQATKKDGSYMKGVVSLNGA
jgi:L-iditol 2-dehydrogenase